MRVAFTLKKARRHWEILAHVEEANTVRVWRSIQRPTEREFQTAVFAAMAGMSAMANIVGLRVVFAAEAQIEQNPANVPGDV